MVEVAIRGEHNSLGTLFFLTLELILFCRMEMNSKTRWVFFFNMTAGLWFLHSMLVHI